MNRVQYIRIEIWESKAFRKYKIWSGKNSTCRFLSKLALNYIKQAQYNSKQDISSFIWFQQTISDKVVIAR